MEELNLTPIQTDSSVEAQLEQSGRLAVQSAKELKITCQEDYETAGKYLVGIKTRTKQIKDYWKGPKQAAQAAHKAVVDREKQMLQPLEEAERILKASMMQYQAAVEKARREAEEAARKRQQEEAARLLDEAIKKEDAGDEQGAAIGMAMAQMVDEMPAAAPVAAPTAAGTAVKKTWKARVIDPEAVPAYFNGIEIRSINMSALNNMAKMFKGTAQVPGVEFYQESSLSVRT